MPILHLKDNSCSLSLHLVREIMPRVLSIETSGCCNAPSRKKCLVPCLDLLGRCLSRPALRKNKNWEIVTMCNCHHHHHHHHPHQSTCASLTPFYFNVIALVMHADCLHSHVQRCWSFFTSHLLTIVHLGNGLCFLICNMRIMPTKCFGKD